MTSNRVVHAEVRPSSLNLDPGSVFSTAPHQERQPGVIG